MAADGFGGYFCTCIYGKIEESSTVWEKVSSDSEDNDGQNEKSEDASNPYNTWKKTALLSPVKGELRPAGLIEIEWQRTPVDEDFPLF